MSNASPVVCFDPDTPAADAPVDGVESAGDGGEDTLIIDGGTTSGAIL